MKIRTHRELEVYKLAFQIAVEIYHMSKSFPKDEIYSLTDQIRRSSRSVCANLAEAFRKRKYPKHFVSKLTDSESEAAETQVWLDFALEFNYIDEDTHTRLDSSCNSVIGMLVTMSNQPEKWS
jgi:four helix bundle protein